MKRSKKLITKISALTLALLTMLTFTSCANVLEFVEDLSIKKQEVTDDSYWCYAGMQNYEVKSKDKEETEDIFGSYTDKLYASIYNAQYAINVWETTADNTKSPAGLYDYIECKDGKIVHHHFMGIGDASFINGGSVYSTCEESITEIGTYNGKDIEVNIENSVKAFASEDKIIIKIEETLEDGDTFIGELVFELMDDDDLDRYSRSYIKPAKTN